MKIVIVGGVAGGASAAARLRRLDESAKIVMFERGAYISYANCGLPYYVGGTIERQQKLSVMTATAFSQRFNVEVRTCSTVTAVDPANKTVTVKSADGEYTESFDKLVLSPGARPIVPSFSAENMPGLFTVRTVDDAVNMRSYIEQNSPNNALVIGGGFIGVEMAENLVKAGLEVTLAERCNRLIPPLDEDVSCEIHNYITGKGLKLRLNTSVKSLKQVGVGIESVGIEAEMEDGTKGIYGMVILAVGVQPDTAFLSGSGIALSDTGAILTDSTMATSFPDIFAVGDAIQVKDFVTGEPAFLPFAGPANRQGRIAADNICGINSHYKDTQGSSVIKVFDMTAAMTGISERTAKRLKLDYGKVHVIPLSHAEYYPGGQFMTVKVLYQKGTGRILGAQLAGFLGVDKRCDVLAVAVRHKLTAADLSELELCYAPPYSSAKDPVNIAGFAIQNILDGWVKNIFVEDLPGIIADSRAQKIDVRTERETEQGLIPGFVNKPLHTLRDNLDTLDSNRPVYVCCKSGQRSYIAARILTQNGFDAYNLSGGYTMYHSMKNAFPDEIKI